MVIARRLKALLVLCCLSAPLAAFHTGKTFLASRDNKSYHLIDVKSQYLLFDKKYKGYGFAFRAEGFYQESVNKEDLARYFGVNDKTCLLFNGYTNPKSDVFYDFLIHKHAASDHDVSERLALEPEQNSYGAVLTGVLYLDQLFKGAYVGVAVPIVEVENKLNAHFGSQENFLPEEDSAWLRNYLFGEFEETEDQSALQNKLCNAKFSCSKKASGVADVELSAGWRFKICKGFKHRGVIGAHVLIPAGNKPKGEFLFEPIYGSGRHVGFGTFSYHSFVLAKTDNWKFKTQGGAKYQFLFSEVQKRTLGIKGKNFGQYYLLGKNGDVQKPLTPAANILTLDVEVSPDSRIETVLTGIAKYKECLAFALGYAYFCSEGERIELEDCFPEETYAIANEEYNTALSTAFGSDETDFASLRAGDWLKKTDLDLGAAATPNQTTHKLFANVAGHFTTKGVLVHGNVTGWYQVPSQNDTLELWGVSLGISMRV